MAQRWHQCSVIQTLGHSGIRECPNDFCIKKGTVSIFYLILFLLDHLLGLDKHLFMKNVDKVCLLENTSEK